MAAGSKEKELEDTLPGAEDLAVSAEASELRRRLLAVGSNDNAAQQRSSTGTPPPVAVDQPASNDRLRATLQFVRRRPAGNEEVTVTAVSGVPLPAREAPGSEAEVVAVRPSRARIVLPFVAGALLVLVALIHRTLSSSDPAPTSAPVAPKAAGLLVVPASPRPDAPPPVSTPSTVSAPKASAQASAPAVPPPPEPSRSPSSDALAAGRSKSASRSKMAPTPRETARAVEAEAPASPEPTISEAPLSPPAAKAKPRPRLVDDAPRPTLLD
jgi:hypothetical protein